MDAGAQNADVSNNSWGLDGCSYDGSVNVWGRHAVWDSTPTSDYLTDPLKADLDLYVYGPNQYQYSVSWDNSYEVVDFTAAVSGSFQIKVKNHRFDGVNEYVAVAWSLS